MNHLQNKEFINLPSSNTSRNYSHCSYKQNSNLIQQMPHNEFFMQYPLQPKDSNSYEVNGFDIESRDPNIIQESSSNRSKQFKNKNTITLIERRRFTSPTSRNQIKNPRQEQLITKFIDKLKISSNHYVEYQCVNQLLQNGQLQDVFCENQNESPKLYSIKNSIKIPIPCYSRIRQIQKIIMQVTYIITLLFSPLILIYPNSTEIILLLFSLLILNVLNNLLNLHTTYYQNDKEITNLKQIQFNYIRRYLIKDILIYLSYILIMQFSITDLSIKIIGIIVLNIITIQKVKLHNPLSQSLIVLITYRFSIAISYCHLFTLIQISINHQNIIHEQISMQFSTYLTYLHKYIDEYLTIFGSISHETSFELQLAIFVQIVQTCNRIGVFLEILFYFYQNIDQYLLRKHYFDFKAFLNYHKIDTQLKKKALSNYKYEMKNDLSQQTALIDAKSIKYLKGEIYKNIENTIKANYFDKINIFSKFSQDIQKRLIEKMICQTFQSNDIILKQNERDDDSLYLIKKGCVKICYTGINNAQNGIKQLNKFQTFGEVSFFTGLPRTCSVICLGPVEVYKITRNDLLNVIQYNRSDFEIASFLKDQIIFGNQYHQIGLKCFCCNATDHLLFSCDKLHYSPNKEKVLSQYSFNHNQIRKKYRRNNTRTQNSRDYLFQLGMAGEEFQENNFLNDSLILKDLSNNQNYQSSSYIQQNQSQQFSYIPVINRPKPSNSILLNNEQDDLKDSCLEMDTGVLRKDQQIYPQPNQLQMKSIINELEYEDQSSQSINNQTISQVQNNQQIQTNKVDHSDKLFDMYILGSNNLQQLNQKITPKNSNIQELKTFRQNKKSQSYTTQTDISKKLETFKGSFRTNLYLDEPDKNYIEQQYQGQKRRKSQPSYNFKQEENQFIALTSVMNQNNFFCLEGDEEFEKAQNFSQYYPFFNPDFVIKKYNHLIHKQQQQSLLNKSKYTISYVLSHRIKEKVNNKQY